MDYLLYAKTFWSEHDGRRPVSRDWYTDRRWLWEKLRRGDRLWVVIAAPRKAPGEWRLLERLEVARPDPVIGRSGRKYRIVGSRKRSEVFDFTERSPDVAPLLRRLDFSSGRRIEHRSTAIGRGIRTPRRLTPEDAGKLTDFASRLGRP